MGAFYDIWIGSKPAYNRKGNEHWELKGANTWLSLSHNANNSFLTTASSDDHEVILIGQLYEDITVEQLLEKCVDYISNKNGVYKDPPGHYIIFVRSKVDESIHVFTNRLGTYHAYWSDENKHKSISTYFLGMAKNSVSKELDWQGLTGFMAMGYFPNDTTYIKNIKVFAPASYYHFDKELNLKSHNRYWNWKYSPVEKNKEEYLSDIKKTLAQTIKYATSNHSVALPISGGLDSRLLAGELSFVELDNIRSFSYGYDGKSAENKVAEQVAASIQTIHHSYIMPNYLFDRMGDIVNSVELFQYVDGTRQVSASGWLERESDVVVGGHWGDIWFDNDPNINNDPQDTFSKKIIKKGSSWLLENICAKYIPNHNEYLQAYFNSFQDKYSNISSKSFLFKIYKTEEWSHRWTTASLRAYQLGSFPVLPFYDSRLVDLFLTIPEKYLSNRQLQIDYIKKYYPHLAKIKWQEYDASLYNYKKYNNRNIIYRAVNKTKRAVTGKQPTLRNWEVFYMNANGKAELEKILINNAMLSNYVAEEKVRNLIDDLYAHPSAANGYTVSMLLTFAIFLNEVYSR